MDVPQTVIVPATVTATVATNTVHVNAVEEPAQAPINVTLVFMKVDTKRNYEKIVEFEQHYSTIHTYMLTIVDEADKRDIWLRIVGLIETWDIVRN